MSVESRKLMCPENGDTADLMQRALAFHKQGDLEAAAGLYQTILKTDTAHFGAQHMLGTVMLQRGRLDEAIILISGALGKQPDSFHALSDAAFALFLANRFDEAIAHYNRAIAIHPDDADAHFNRGNALASLNRLDEAIADYDQAVATRSDFADAFNVGEDERHIATVDADGVALAAIQGLNQKLVEELKQRDAEIQGLRQQLMELKTTLGKQAVHTEGGGR